MEEEAVFGCVNVLLTEIHACMHGHFVHRCRASQFPALPAKQLLLVGHSATLYSGQVGFPLSR